MDRLAINVALKCEWDLEAEGERPHLTPRDMEAVDDLSYGTMSYI